jgi:sugar/nucleoside kinase (ribokinase family)
MGRQGITAGGNFIRDYTRIIDDYPEQETLANILAMDSSNGGAPYNVLKNLSKMGVNFPLSAIGIIGNDETGKEIVNDCTRHHIDTRGILLTDQAGTSFTDVMVVRNTGKRTFFHYRGANAMLASGHFDFNPVNSKIFHLGYLLLLDTLDQSDFNGRTQASIVLEKAMKAGLTVSVDLVSVNTPSFKDVVLPSLPYIDYLFLNEFEAEKLTGISSTAKNHIIPEKAIEACEKILDLGVNNTVVLHFPEGAIARSRNSTNIMGSVIFPPDKIAGTTGAGDAFAAGYLYGIHENLTERECLRTGVCVAASSLAHETCSEGILQLENCLALGDQYGFRKLE